MDWLNPPPEWSEERGVLTVVTGERTDFWRETHYGFIRDNGHFRGVDAPGNFSAGLAFRGDYRELYDQAGIMLRVDARNWIKAGIEFVAGRRMLSVVVTRDFSDWSTMPCPVDAEWLRVRLTRIGTAVHIHWAADDEASEFRMMRLAHLPAGPTAVGPMCCSPQRAGFVAAFRGLTVGEAMGPTEG